MTKAAAFALALAALAASPALAGTDQRVDVIGIPADMPTIASTRCVAPMVCLKKGEVRIASYDPGIWGSAKFYPGDVTLRDGTVLTGRVALLALRNDWSFVKQVILVIPEGESQALFFREGDALLIHQSRDGATETWDRYGNTYLRRQVSGTVRLSYNPAAGTSRPLSAFVPVSVLSNLSGAAGKQALIAALRDGKSAGESLRSGQNVGSAVSDVLGSIEVTEKEYLLFDERTSTTTAITKANYADTIQRLFAGCAAVDAKTVQGFAKKYGAIEAAITAYNARCVA